MARRAVVAGDGVIRRGDPGDELFLVRSGSCDIGAKLSQTSVQLTLMEHD